MKEPDNVPDPTLTGSRPKRTGFMLPLTIVVFVGFLILAAILSGAVNVNLKADWAKLLLNGFAILLFVLALVGLLRLASYRSPKAPPNALSADKKSPPP